MIRQLALFDYPKYFAIRFLAISLASGCCLLTVTESRILTSASKSRLFSIIRMELDTRALLPLLFLSKPAWNIKSTNVDLDPGQCFIVSY